MLYIFQIVTLIIGYIVFIYYETRKYLRDKIEMKKNEIIRSMPTPEQFQENIMMVLYDKSTDG